MDIPGSNQSGAKREAYWWGGTGVIFICAAGVLLIFMTDLEPVAGMTTIKYYLLVPAIVIAIFGTLIIGAAVGFAGSKPWALKFLRVITYLLLLSFLIETLFMLVVWARKWSTISSIGTEDIGAALAIVLTLIVGIRGLRTIKRLS